MATQVEESPLEAREDRLRRKAKRKSAKADRLEARGKTKRAAKKRGAAGVKTAKADKIAGKQDAKDKKQAGKQAKKLAKVKGKVDKKAEKKENKSTKRDERKEKRGKKIKKAKADITAAGKAAGKKVSGAVKGVKDKVKGAKEKVKERKDKIKEGIKVAVAMHGPSMGDDRKAEKKARHEARKATRERGMSAYGEGKDEYKRKDGHKAGDIDGHYKDYEGPSMGVHDDDTDYRGHAMDQMKGGNWDGSAMHGPSKYDNAHMLKNPGHHQAPSMSGQAYDKKKMFSTKGKERLHYLENWMHDKKGGSPISHHFGRNRSKKR